MREAGSAGGDDSFYSHARKPQAPPRARLGTTSSPRFAPYRSISWTSN